MRLGGPLDTEPANHQEPHLEPEPTPDEGSTERPDEGASFEQTAAPVRKKHRRVVRKGKEREVIFGVTNDEIELTNRPSSTGPRDPNSNDERLLRDVPPHWGRR